MPNASEQASIPQPSVAVQQKVEPQEEAPVFLEANPVLEQNPLPIEMPAIEVSQIDKTADISSESEFVAGISMDDFMSQLNGEVASIAENGVSAEQMQNQTNAQFTEQRHADWENESTRIAPTYKVEHLVSEGESETDRYDRESLNLEAARQHRILAQELAKADSEETNNEILQEKQARLEIAQTVLDVNPENMGLADKISAEDAKMNHDYDASKVEVISDLAQQGEIDKSETIGILVSTRGVIMSNEQVDDAISTVTDKMSSVVSEDLDNALLIKTDDGYTFKAQDGKDLVSLDSKEIHVINANSIYTKATADLENPTGDIQKMLQAAKALNNAGIYLSNWQAGGECPVKMRVSKKVAQKNYTPLEAKNLMKGIDSSVTPKKDKQIIKPLPDVVVTQSDVPKYTRQPQNEHKQSVTDIQKPVKTVQPDLKLPHDGSQSGVKQTEVNFVSQQNKAGLQAEIKRPNQNKIVDAPKAILSSPVATRLFDGRIPGSGMPISLEGIKSSLPESFFPKTLSPQEHLRPNIISRVELSGINILRSSSRNLEIGSILKDAMEQAEAAGLLPPPRTDIAPIASIKVTESTRYEKSNANDQKKMADEVSKESSSTGKSEAAPKIIHVKIEGLGENQHIVSSETSKVSIKTESVSENIISEDISKEQQTTAWTTDVHQGASVIRPKVTVISHDQGSTRQEARQNSDTKITEKFATNQKKRTESSHMTSVNIENTTQEFVADVQTNQTSQERPSVSFTSHEQTQVTKSSGLEEDQDAVRTVFNMIKNARVETKHSKSEATKEKKTKKKTEMEDDETQKALGTNEAGIRFSPHFDPVQQMQPQLPEDQFVSHSQQAMQKQHIKAALSLALDLKSQAFFPTDQIQARDMVAQFLSEFQHSPVEQAV